MPDTKRASLLLNSLLQKCSNLCQCTQCFFNLSLTNIKYLIHFSSLECGLHWKRCYSAQQQVMILHLSQSQESVFHYITVVTGCHCNSSQTIKLQSSAESRTNEIFPCLLSSYLKKDVVLTSIEILQA